MRPARLLRLAVAAIPAVLTMTAVAPAAATTLTGPADTRNLLRWNYTLAANDNIDVTTSNCDSGEDTVIFLLNTSAQNLASMNDDYGGTYCSHINYTNNTGVQQNYTLMISSYTYNQPSFVHVQVARTGAATTDSDQWIGGIVSREIVSGWFDVVTAPARIADGGGSTDTVVFALDAFGNQYQYDDDNGPALLSSTQAGLTCANWAPCWIVAGNYWYTNTSDPGTNARLWLWNDSSGDSDADGISDELENFGIGTSVSNADTDSDGLRDGYELMGVMASSLSGWDSSVMLAWEGWNDPDASSRGADPTVQDLFIQVDYMIAALHDHNPLTSGNWTTIQSDLTAMFLQDWSWTGRLIRTHVNVQNGLTETPLLGFESCPSATGYSSFYDNFKSSPFVFDPLRATTHHYVIFGHDLGVSCGNAAGVSGRSEEWGSDAIVSLGSYSNSVGLPTEQHGTFNHEFGHTLALNHNGNGNNNGNNSCIHSSPMNYRYQFGGWGDGSISSIRRYSYSRGACDASGLSCGNSCTSTCVPSAQSSPKQNCSPNNGTCDCDKTEWSLVNTDFVDETDELTTWHYCRLNPSQCDGAGGRARARARAFEPYFLGDAGRFASFHRDLGQRRRAKLKAAGLREGIDFVFDPVLHRNYAVE